jgi:hypothetical protein
MQKERWIMNNKQDGIMTAVEIGTMAGQLNTTNQSYVLNTINALLFSQQVSESAPTDRNQDKRLAKKKENGESAENQD